MHNEKITERARGRWRGILTALGVDPKLLNGKHHPCPICRAGKDRFRFVDYDGSGWFICSQCSGGKGGSGFDFLMRLKGYDFKAAAREVERIIGTCKPDPKKPEIAEADKRAAMNKLWGAGQIITARDPVGRYLAKRCGLNEFPAALRCVESLHYSGSPHYWPVMIAKLTKPDELPCNIHRTYLTADGSKAPVEAPRRMMPGSIMKGSAVRLSPVAQSIGIAEGIETALSAAILFGIPTWAALNAEMLKTWQPPEGVKKVTIFGDNDESFTGQAAAFGLARRLAMAGIAVETKIPEQIGEDWNDVHMRMQTERSAA